MERLPNGIKNLKLSRQKSADDVLYKNPYAKLVRNDGYTLIMNKGKFPGETYEGMKDEALKWVLKILDEVAIHPVPIAREAVFPVWFGTQPYSGYGFEDSRWGVFLLFAFDWEEIYWYLEDQRDDEDEEEEDEEEDIPNPVYDVGKTIPGFVSYEAGYIDQLEAPYLLGFYKKGRWVPVEYQFSRGFYY